MTERDEAFIDTGFFVALAHIDDRHHAPARTLHRGLQARGTRRVTTEFVLIELGDSLSRLRQRAAAQSIIEAVVQEPTIEIVPATSEWFIFGWELYIRRPDKEWGLTDCISFEVMRRRGITLALTVDRHFVQAGFDAPLLAET